MYLENSVWAFSLFLFSFLFFFRNKDSPPSEMKPHKHTGLCPAQLEIVGWFYDMLCHEGILIIFLACCLVELGQRVFTSSAHSSCDAAGWSWSGFDWWSNGQFDNHLTNYKQTSDVILDILMDFIGTGEANRTTRILEKINKRKWQMTHAYWFLDYIYHNLRI